MIEIKAPSIRFRGYDDIWKQFKLDEIVSPYSDPIPTPNNGYIRLGLRSHAKGTFHSLVLPGMELETAQMHRVGANNLIVNITFAWEHAVAITSEKDSGKLVSHRFPQFSFREGMVSEFFKFKIQDEKFRYHLWLSSPGGAGRNRVLKTNEMLQYLLWVPRAKEQIKIALYLEELDKLITRKQLIHEKLQNLKSAMLEKMFPKEGADVPEVRFKGFSEPWETKKLSEITTIKARIGWQGLTRKEFLEQGEYYLITGVDFKNGEIDYTQCHFVGEDRYNQDTNIQLKTNDVLITKDGTLGKVAHIKSLDKPATLNTGVFVIRSNSEDIFSLYIYHYLAAPFLLHYANKQATGGTIKHLNQNVLINFPVPLPKLEEQIRIGTFLSSLDDLSTNHLHELKKIKHFKKSMLERMFV